MVRENYFVWSASMIEVLRARRNESNAELGRVFGCSAVRVRSARYRYDAHPHEGPRPSKRRIFTAEEQALASRLVDEGERHSVIARALQCSRPVVTGLLRSLATSRQKAELEQALNARDLDVRRPRRCLGPCSSLFLSDWPGERFCGDCRPDFERARRDSMNSEYSVEDSPYRGRGQ